MTAKIRMRRWLALLSLATGASLACPANAHPGHTRSTRIVHIDLSSAQPSLKYGYVFDTAGSESARREADRDADGTVSEYEGQAEVKRWGEELRRQFSVCRGRALESLRCAAPAVAEVLAESATGWESRPGKPLSLVWELSLRIEPTDRALEFRDTWRRPEIQHTDAIIGLPSEARLVQTAPNPVSRADGAVAFVWQADGAEPRRFGVSWEPPPSRALVLGVVGSASLLVTAALLLRARRRQASAPS